MSLVSQLTFLMHLNQIENIARSWMNVKVLSVKGEDLHGKICATVIKKQQEKRIRSSHLKFKWEY